MKAVRGDVIDEAHWEEKINEFSGPKSGKRERIREVEDIYVNKQCNLGQAVVLLITVSFLPL